MSALFAPGSTPWLLRNEIRLAFRNLGGKGMSRSRMIRVGAGLLIAAVALGFAGWKLSGVIVRHPVPMTSLTVVLLEAAMAAVGTLMLAQALNQATQAFFERNDLDLLLSSPLDPQRLLTVRALGVATLVGSFYAALVSLLVVPLLIRGAWGWLSLYAVVIDLALLSTGIGLLLAVSLFRLLGAKRTRLVSQVLAAVIGASVFLVSQARNFMSQAQLNALFRQLSGFRGQGFDAGALYAWPGRAALGDPVPLLAFSVLCVGVFALAARVMGARFADDAAAAAGVSHSDAAPVRRRAAAADRRSFAKGPLHALATKDRLLLMRDPWLLSQMLLQLIYFVPLGFLIWRNIHGNVVLAAAAPLVFLSAQLAGNLAWVVVSAEDAPELIVSAPVSGLSIVQAKLAVALAPVAVLAAAPLAFLVYASPLGGLAVTGCCLGAWTSSALMNVWYAKPADRRQMRRRGQSGIMALVETLLNLLWAGAAFLAVFAPVWAPIPVAVAVLALAVLRRPTVYRPALA